MPIAPPSNASAPEWTFVQELLHDLQAGEHREELAYLYGQWRLSIRAFRRVEWRRMTAMEPTESDLLFHKACVTDLMSFGTLLQIAAEQQPAEELAPSRIRLEVISAILRDLHNTFDEWHAQIPAARVDALAAAIFNATPELHLASSRA
jgi:hypothetical protein